MEPAPAVQLIDPRPEILERFRYLGPFQVSDVSVPVLDRRVAVDEPFQGLARCESVLVSLIEPGLVREGMG